MNRSWEAYENGLKLLAENIPLEHPLHADIRVLCSRLQENLAQTRSGENGIQLRIDRKRDIADLNEKVQHIMGRSFLDVCIVSNTLLQYLTCVYRLVQEGCKLFSGIEEIWADQCKDIAERFYQRLPLEHIVIEVSRSVVELYHIDSCITTLVQLIEDFAKYCPPNRKATESLRDKRKRIHSELVQCIEKIQYIDNSSFEEFIGVYGETTSSLPVTQPLTNTPISEQGQNSPHHHTCENSDPLSRTQADVTKTERQNFHREAVSKKEEISIKIDIDLSDLREKMVRLLSLGELDTLCADIEQILRNDGISEPINLDMLNGEGLREKVQSLIGHLNRRGWLNYLMLAMRKTRSNFEL